MSNTEVINDLFNPIWEKKHTPRTYYKATASNGVFALRSSWRDMYSHACIKVETQILFDNQLTYATYHSTEKLAERNVKSYTKYYEGRIKFELVELERITAKEYRRLKRLEQKSLKEYREKRNAIALQAVEMSKQQHLTTTGGN